MPMEAEVVGLFIGGVCMVLLLTAVGLWVCLKEKHWGALRCFVGQLIFTALSLFFLSRVLFAGRSVFPAVGGIPSIDNSVGIGLFGVCWALSMLCMVSGIKNLCSEKQAQDETPKKDIHK